MNEDRKVIVPEQLMTALLEYLSQRPFREVAILIDGLQRQSEFLDSEDES